MLLAMSILTCGAAHSVRADNVTSVPEHAAEFLANNCHDCHQGDEPEAGLDLEQLSFDLDNHDSVSRWVRILDRVRDGEMPPPDYNTLEPVAKTQFLEHIGQPIRDHQHAQQKAVGRVLARRLTRKQIERSHHDLLGIDIPLAEYLPEESRQGRYSTVADGQAMSHFQMQAHLAVVDRALDEAFRRALSAKDEFRREFDARGMARRNPKRRCREPEMRQGQAVIWNGGVTFYGRIPAAAAPRDGWYRFALTVSALKSPAEGGVWSSIHTGLCVSSAPLLTHIASFEATPEPRTIEFEAWLPKDHMLEIRPADATLKRGRFAGGQIGTGEGEPQDIPGIAFDRLTMQRIHREPRNAVRQRLFGDLKFNKRQPISDTPENDVERMLLAFAERAFRRPVEREAIQQYIEAAHSRLADSDDIVATLRFGYRAILCSPRFLYFNEQPGPLDSHELATRLSYFLTGSCPDAALRSLADSGELKDEEVLHAEIDRLLSNQPNDRSFVRDFAAEWLDLEKLNETVPDRKLYPDFDPVVSKSMLNETHAYLDHLLAENQSVLRLIASDFTFLNNRLARYYDIENVDGDALQLVKLPPESARGGLLTHGSILKITANGTNTSPVLRGVWISERLLGIPIPPPPENVPAIEPDIRGATTIREQLELHRSDDACASCHRKIDPSGFALENFDAAGQWREFYGKPKGKKGRSRLKIDASYHWLDGEEFRDVRDFRQLVAADCRRIARNVVENMLVYGSGGPVQFSDREAVEAIVDRVADDNFGFRSIVHAVATSAVFMSK